MANLATNVSSGNPNIDGLLGTYRWSASELTWGIPRRGQWSGYSSGTEPYYFYEELNSGQESAARSVLSQLDGIIGLDFRELSNELTTAPSDQRPQNADIRIGQTLYGASDDFFVAYAYLPFPVEGLTILQADQMSGDVWVYNDEEDPFPGSIFATPQAGNYEYFTFLHEIGHALGLKHPHEPEGSFEIMPLATDQMSYTVMSYRSYEGQSTSSEDGYSNGDWDFPQTYMIWDIAALQYMYGAELNYRWSDTVYSWSPDSGQTRVDGSVWLNPGANKLFLTIYDSGGFDTFDFSAYATDLSVDLNPEAWTVVSTAQLANLGDGHFAPGNIANPRLINYFGSDRYLIEKAVGGSANDRLIGNSAANTLVGNAGDDYLDGGIQLDTLIGGPGNDIYVIDHPSDVIVEEAGEGVDSVEAGFSFTLPANVENLTSTTNFQMNLTGNDLVNVITGGVANDVIDGKGGADRMIGGGGNDTYHVDDSGDVIEDSAGTDTVVVAASYVLTGDMIENVTLSGSASINATGNGVANVITGNSGDNFLDGAGGVDVLRGGLGNDIYLVDNAGEASEEFNSGVDEVRTALASFTLADNIENLTGLAGAGQTLTGNGSANVITGTAFNDVIDGRFGADTMIGGLGNDSYTIDNSGDVIVELAGGGTDTVLTSASYILSPDLENLTLLGNGAINGTGNALDNVINGNLGANVLDGGAGADTLNGGSGSDIYIIDALDTIFDTGGTADEVRTTAASYTLTGGIENLTGLLSTGQTLRGSFADNLIIGGAGDDFLDGQYGSDTVRGGLGNDIYVVDSAADIVTELAGEGFDEVRMSLSVYTLGANIERLHALGYGPFWLTGNDLNNEILGGLGTDHIDGGLGVDTLMGGAGNDIYTTDGSDIIVELYGEGVDRVETAAAAYTLAANVEALTGLSATGQALTGNGLDNGIVGGSGNDVLDGAGGIDTLYGGDGGDIYYLGDGDSAIEAYSDSGIDEVRTALSAYVLHSNVENLTGIAAAGQSLNGNDLDNLISGGVGHDLIDGGTGADSMRGGLGNDVYLVDNGGDSIVELEGAGTDEVRTALAAFSIAGFANVENLTGGAGGQSLTGNGFDNVIDGAAGADSMAGGGGNDTYIIDNASDTISELDGGGTDGVRTAFASFSIAGFAYVENLTGGAGDQNLTGNGWNNVIDGGAGADTMAGGGGHDVYIVDNLGDVVVEADGAGIDEIRTGLGSKAPPERAVYVLPNFVENLTGTSAGAQGVRDNALNNIISMGAGHDLVVADSGGIDTINGGAGNDFIYCGDKLTAADVTNGGAGADTIGLIGNYASGITFTAANLIGVERMALYTSLYLPGTGPNNYNVTMSDANVAAGTEFFVTAASLQSNESLTFNGSAETDGRFTVHGGAGNDTISGGSGSDFFLGNAGNDAINGGGGNDFLYGGLGADQLTGGAGFDAFRYQSAAQSTAASMDHILDFTDLDRIDLSAIDADGNPGNGNQAFTFIGSNAFGSVAGQLRATELGGVWTVEGDVNGDGVAELVMQVTITDPMLLVLGASDFNL